MNHRILIPLLSAIIASTGCDKQQDQQVAEHLDRLFMLRKQRERALLEMQSWFGVAADCVAEDKFKDSKEASDRGSRTAELAAALHEEIIDLIDLLESRYGHKESREDEHRDHMHALDLQARSMRLYGDALRAANERQK